MSNPFAITNFMALRPTIVLWNRLEGRPRTDDFDRALKAEVRDALWMLTKQWQLGEFRGDDAGSPVFAKIQVATTQLNKYQANGHAVQPFEDDVPLEAKVEQRAIPFDIGGQKIALDLRLQMGRQWLKMVSKVVDVGLDEIVQAYIDHYPIEMPASDSEKDAQVCAHPEVWAQFAAVAGRAMDGAALYFHLKANPDAHHAVPKDRQDAINQVAERFLCWCENLYYQPQDPENDAWQPSYLEYQFACSAPEAGGEKVFVADEYYHGHLDWYNLDVVKPENEGLSEVSDDAMPDDQEPSSPQSFIPVPLIFDGMPNTRWWTFEEGRTNFGDIQPDTTDLAKLLLIEFGLVYANDWFLFPLTLPAGSIARIKGLALTNVFGERFWIEPAGSGAGEGWQSWSMFTLNVKDHAEEPADMSMLLLPTVPKIQEGAALDEVVLIRDEMANMVWGIETVIPLADGSSKSGHEAAIEMRNHLQKPPVTPVKYKADIRYQVMNTVPENWIPFIPVHVEGDNREIQLQRAAMPRILEGDPEPPKNKKVRPRTIILREADFVHEEEVPRAGIRVSQSFQRTRWYNGRVFVWLGVRKQTGRGEGSSGLAFDRIEYVG